MAGRFLVLHGVLVLGGVAARNASTFETHSQVYPRVASRDALGAFRVDGSGRKVTSVRWLQTTGITPSGRQTGLQIEKVCTSVKAAAWERRNDP